MDKVRKFRLVLLLAYVVVALILVTVATLAQTTGIQVGQLTRDVSASADLPPYTGIVSKVGIFLWCSTMTVCFFGYALVRRSTSLGEARPFLLASGSLNAFLLVGDSFPLHETINQALDVREVYILAVYIAIMLSYLVVFRNVILATGPLLLIVALGFLGLSVAVDIQPPPVPSLGAQFLLEDGFKLLGVVTWFFYFASTCAEFVSGTLREFTPGKE